MYQRKFKTGTHYIEAYNNLRSELYGIVGTNDKGEIIESGTIAQSQVQVFIDNDKEVIDGEFVLNHKEFEIAANNFTKLQDEYIIKNNIIIN